MAQRQALLCNPPRYESARNSRHLRRRTQLQLRHLQQHTHRHLLRQHHHATPARKARLPLLRNHTRSQRRRTPGVPQDIKALQRNYAPI